LIYWEKEKGTSPFLMHDINSNPPRALAFTGEILLYVALCSIFYIIDFMLFPCDWKPSNTQPYDRSSSDLHNQVHWPYVRLGRFGFA